MKIGLFFGSFNPVHTGHLIIANYILEYSDLQRIWFVVSPHNPLKEKKSLLNQHDRLHLVRLAIEDNSKFKASDIEFKLPQPSYTIDTLIYLHEKFPQHEFSLIMGSDNLATIDKWKNYEHLLERYQFYIYQRKGSTKPAQSPANVSIYHNYPNVHVLETPMIEISATQIRNMLKEKKSVRYLVPEKVYEYLSTSSLYRKSS